MAEFSDSYSRMVAWLKIILPLAALAILSTLFLMSRTVSPQLPLTFSDPETRDLANQPRIGDPAFSGVTADGAVFDLTAKVALPFPDNQPGLTIEGISATFESPEGQLVDILAENGTLNSADQIAILGGGVKLVTSLGYTVVTDTIIANMAESSIRTTGPLDAKGPLGTITAGLMTLRLEDSDNKDSFVLVFRDGVKLVYDPKKYRE